MCIYMYIYIFIYIHIYINIADVKSTNVVRSVFG